MIIELTEIVAGIVLIVVNRACGIRDVLRNKCVFLTGPVNLCQIEAVRQRTGVHIGAGLIRFAFVIGLVRLPADITVFLLQGFDDQIADDDACRRVLVHRNNGGFNEVAKRQRLRIHGNNNVDLANTIRRDGLHGRQCLVERVDDVVFGILALCGASVVDVLDTLFVSSHELLPLFSGVVRFRVLVELLFQALERCFSVVGQVIAVAPERVQRDLAVRHARRGRIPLFAGAVLGVVPAHERLAGVGCARHLALVNLIMYRPGQRCAAAQCTAVGIKGDRTLLRSVHIERTGTTRAIEEAETGKGSRAGGDTSRADLLVVGRFVRVIIGADLLQLPLAVHELERIGICIDVRIDLSAAKERIYLTELVECHAGSLRIDSRHIDQ